MAHREVCQIKKCPEKAVARLRDHPNTRRVDLCFRHCIVELRDHRDEVVIMETWGTTEAALNLGVEKLKELRYG